MKSPRLFAATGALLFLLTASGAHASSSVENPLFGYTHRLPSPFTVPQGHLVLGTEVAYGVTDFLEVGTSVINDAYKVFNAHAKVALVDYPEFAFGLNLEWEHYNIRDFALGNPDLAVNSWMPGAVGAYAILPELAVFLGGNLNITSTELQANGVSRSGFVRGAQAGSDVSWAYNPKKKKSKKGGGIGNVLSAGVSYDFNYKLLGFGLSHHWPGFHLGFHYYPAAEYTPFQPIIAGGMAFDF
jgi:hypothetical protein